MLRGEAALPWADDTLLLRNARAGLGAGLRVTPSFIGARAFLEAEPAALLVVRAGAEALAFFGSFSNLLEMPGDGADFSLEARNARAAEARAALAYRVFLSPSLRFRLGPVIGFADASLDHFWADAASHFYEPTSDVVLAKGDWLFTVLAVALYEWGPARVGLVHRTAWVPRSGYASHRTGPGAIFKLADRWGPFASPVLMTAVCLYLQDRHKAWTPYFAAALAFDLQPIEVLPQ